MFQRQWRQAQRPRRHVTTKSKTAGKKTAHRKRADWDNTVSDLSVHQLSREELELRRSRILSKNADRAKRELEEIVTGNTSGVGKPTGEQSKEKLHSILEESDRALSVVKDLFGDDPKRYSGQPNVTVAPHVTTNKAALQRTLLESRLDGPTPSALNSPGGIRDESILGLAPVKPALNDLPSPSSDFTIDESTFEDSSLRLSPPVAPYQPVVVDFPRFQRLVEEHGETGEGVGSGERGGGEVGERVEGDELSSIAHTGSQQGGGNVTVDSNMDLPKGGVSGPTSGHPQNTIALQNQHHPLEIAHKMPSFVTARPTTTATSGSSRTILANQPAFVQESSHSVSRNQRVRRLPPGRATTTGAASNGIHDDLSVLQKLVQDLERELLDYEKTSGYSFPVKKPAAAQSGTFTSLTASLLASVTKLTHYLKQSEVQLKGEVAVRNQLLHAMGEQQNLMDALTADVVKLQEENSSLKSGLQQLEQTTAQHTKILQEDVLELRTKIGALEQIKPFPVKSSVATSQPTGSNGEASASAMTSPPASFAKASPERVVDNCDSSIPPSPQHFYSSRLAPSITNTQGPPLDASLGPTPVLPSSMKSFLPHPAMFYHPWSLANTGPGMESTPALYQTPADGLTKPSLYLPFTPTPLSALSVPQVTPGLSMTTLSPPGVSVSPLPLGSASQTPPISLPAPNVNVSDSFLSQVPSFSVPPSGVGVPLSLAPQFPSITLPPSNVNDSPVSLVSQAAVYVPRSSVSGCALPLSLPSQPPPAYQPTRTLPFQPMPLQQSSLSSHRPPSNPAVSVQLPPLPPLSLPYSWEAPVATFPSLSRGTTVHTLPSGSPAPRTNPTSLATVTLRKTATTVPAPPMTQPDLSLSLSSLPAPEGTSRRSEVSPSQSSESSLDIEASLARMSSLARSVLQELAQDRGHLLSNSSQSPHSYSTPFPPPPGQKRYLSAVESVGSSMTTVTSLDSELTPPSVDSLATQESHQLHDLPTPSSTVKDSPTSVSTQ